MYLCRAAENRTRAAPTPWAYTTTIRQPGYLGIIANFLDPCQVFLLSVVIGVLVYRQM